MPDAAFVDTEDQFRRAVTAGGPAGSVDLSLYTMPGLARGEATLSVIRSRYLGLDELRRAAPDAVIITGTEPVQAHLPYEPYWPDLAQLLQWAAEEVPTTLLSCLAAHASLLVFDGIERQRLPVKCSGVFGGTSDAGSDPMAVGLPPVVPVPHSRINDVPEEVVTDAGYRVVIGSGRSASGWSVAARVQGAGTFVLCQGHPEYSTESLLREYRRDVRRFLFGRGAVDYPQLPVDYLPPVANARLEEFAARAATGKVDPSQMWETFPYEEVRASLTNTWADSAAIFYANWLGLARSGSSAPGVAG